MCANSPCLVRKNSTTRSTWSRKGQSVSLSYSQTNKQQATDTYFRVECALEAFLFMVCDIDRVVARRDDDFLEFLLELLILEVVTGGGVAMMAMSVSVVR